MLSQKSIDSLRAEFERKAAAPPPKFTEVQRGPEMMRILRAPRRPIPDPASSSSIDLASFLTQQLSKSSTLYPGPLLPVQALALQEAWSQRGLFAPMRAGAGKAQPVSEPVLTPAGWRPIGEIVPGDFVVGSDGRAQRVLSTHPQGVREVVRLGFSDGTYARCDWDHLWTMSVRIGEAKSKPGVRTVTKTAREWSNEKLKRKAGKHTANRIFLPLLSAPVCSPADGDVPVDPYTLGLLLGDGSLSVGVPGFTSMDRELVDALVLPVGVSAIDTGSTRAGRARQYRLSTGVKGQGWGSNPLTAALRRLGLHGKTSHTKFVPEGYRAMATRLALLQGLMDTDGHATKSGGCDYLAASEELVSWASETAEMLGGTARRSVKHVMYLGERRAYYRAHILLPRGVSPFRLGRKVSVWSAATRQHPPIRALVSFTPDNQEECVCLVVENPDCLYVTRHCILTHNTLLAYLLPVVLQAKRPLYVCPAAMKPDVAHEFFQYFRCWKGPSLGQYPIKSYELLSSVSSAEDRDRDGKIIKHALLERLKPDLLVLDEGHRLADSSSAGTKRVRAYLKANPDTMVCYMSGTPFKSSIKDAAHILSWVLGDASVLPDDFLERESWASR